MTDTPTQEWWSAAELAEAGLPGLPTTKRKINELAAREGWKNRAGKVRRRRAAGGGMEYHWSLLPLRARLQLTAPREAVPEPSLSRTDAWAEFEAATGAAQAKARKRLEVLQEVEALEGAGLTRSLAIKSAAKNTGSAIKSIWNWFEKINGIAEEDRLAYLVDRRGVKKPKSTVTASPEFCEIVKSAFLRQGGPEFTACYDWAVDIAEAEGLPILPIHTVRRWYQSTVSKPTEIYHRKGAEALRRSFPHQTRDKAAMVPLECIQGDYHKFDVFVRWPGEKDPVRPQGVFFSDVHSGKMLAWRLDLTANSHTVQLAIGDVIERFGVPQAALLDNGREFAAKVITGGAETRFRFKITDEDIPGLLPMMGVKVHWATPYSGQSKPIERAFRDFCSRIAKHPAFEGAYTGNKPDAKPENYGNRAIPLEEFREVMEREVEKHNARTGRRSEVAFGKSFNDVFNEGYKTAPIRRATDEQRRLWLLRAEGLRAATKNGELKLHGSRYWGEWMYRIAGQKVVARFDGDKLHAGLHVYDLSGSYLGHAPCLEKGDFLDVQAARDVARKRNQFVRTAREAAKAEKEFSAAEIAARLKAAGKIVGDELPEAEVVKLVTPHPKAPSGLRRRQPSAEQREADERLEAQVTRLSSRRAAQAAPDDDPETRFARALELEAMLANEQALTPAQSDWLAEYQQSAEYRGFVRVHRRLGNNDK